MCKTKSSKTRVLSKTETVQNNAVVEHYVTSTCIYISVCLCATLPFTCRNIFSTMKVMYSEYLHQYDVTMTQLFVTYLYNISIFLHQWNDQSNDLLYTIAIMMDKGNKRSIDNTMCSTARLVIIRLQKQYV